MFKKLVCLASFILILFLCSSALAAQESDQDIGKDCGLCTVDDVNSIYSEKATKPQPQDGAVHLNTWVCLNWEAGITAVSHDVYFGEDFNDVNDGTGKTFQDKQSSSYFIIGFPEHPYPDGLVPGTTYYWRVDEADEVKVEGAVIHKGDVWSLEISPSACVSVSNDDYQCAMPITEANDLKFDTTDATSDGPGYYMTSANLWYCFIATQTGGVTVSLLGSSYDTMLAVYDGDDCCQDPCDPIIVNDDFYMLQSQVSFCAKAGQLYLIEVGGYNVLSKGPGVMNISYNDEIYCSANDDCSDAECIGDVIDLEFDTTYATFDGMGYCLRGPNLWYRYIAATTGYVTISVDNFDFAVYQTEDCYASWKNMVTCSYVYSDDPKIEVTFYAFEGNSYLIEVGGYEIDEAGNGRMSIVSYDDKPVLPTNDSWQYPEAIGEVSYFEYDTTDATFDGAGHCMLGPNIWFCYTASETGTATVSLDFSNFDTRLAVYEGCYSPILDKRIACDDDSGNGHSSKVTFPVIAGEQFLIEVGSHSIYEVNWGYLHIFVD